MTLFDDLLVDPYATRKYSVIFKPYDDRTSPTPGIINLYFSEDGLVTEPSDSPANTYFEPRIVSALSFKSELVNKDRIRGQSTPSFGSVVLRNGDSVGEGDITDSDTLDYIDDLNNEGRELEVLLGGELSDGTVLGYSDFGCLGIFTVAGVDISTKEVRLRIADSRVLLNRDCLVNVYGGTGGLDGGSDLEGKPIPLVLGYVRNITPVFVGVVGGLYTFQVNDGEIQDVDEVYSNGSSLIRVSSAPIAGEFIVDRSTGTFQLGGATLDTLITCDVHGLMDNRGSPSNFLEYAGEISEYLVSTFTDATIDSSSFTTLDSSVPYQQGIYIDTQSSVISVISELLNSIGGYLAFNRGGKIKVGQMVAPGSSVVTYGPSEILGEIVRVASVSPTKSVVIGYAKNWTVVSFENIATAVPDATKQFLVEQYRDKSSTASQSAVTEAFPLATEERYDTLLTTLADALAEADRLQALYGVKRRVYKVTVKTQPFVRVLGETVTIEDSRLGLSSGEDYVIIGLDEKSASGRITLTLWG